MRFAALGLVFLACSTPPPAAPDASVETPDAGAVASFDSCTGDCRTVSLTARFGSKSRAFDRAQFGLTAPANTSSGSWELYLEAHAGGEAACPGDDSPTPKMTLVLSGLALPTDATPRTEADGVKAAFFDFSSELTDQPLLRASHVTVTPRALHVCLDADAGACDEPVFAFELDATFEGGEVHGHAFALHCDSYDEP